MEGFGQSEMSIETHHAVEQKLVRDMQSVAVPREFDSLLSRYAKITDDRDELLWKWLYYVFPTFELSTVPPEQRDAARKSKFGFSVFMTILDDISERHRDHRTFEQGRKIPFANAEPVYDTESVDCTQLALLEDTWELTAEFLDSAPRREEFHQLLEFDIRQSLNTMDYNRLVNDGPEITSPTAIEQYDTYNMLLFCYVGIDIAFSPSFSVTDLSTLRDITWEAQKLARIGNWVTTWERELAEDDYTSNVIVTAIDRGVVTVEELQSEAVSTATVIDQIRSTSIEQELLLKWNRTYRELLQTDHGLESVDPYDFIDGMRELLEIDVKAYGLK